MYSMSLFFFEYLMAEENTFTPLTDVSTDTPLLNGDNSILEPNTQEPTPIDLSEETLASSNEEATSLEGNAPLGETSSIESSSLGESNPFPNLGDPVLDLGGSVENAETSGNIS